MGKSQFDSHSLNAREQLSAIDTHPSIVGSAPGAAPGSGPAAEAGCALSWRDEDDTRAFAVRMAALPGLRGAFIALHGDLGVGKTTLVRHLLRALGVQGRVKSPTYAVVEPYEIEAPAIAATSAAPAAPGGTLQVWHFDFYRFGDPREWEDAGFRDIFASPGLKLAEWPEKAAGQLPAADLDLYLAVGDDDRRSVTLRAGTASGRGMLRELCP